MTKTYDNGRQDAWLQAIRENCAQNVGRIEGMIDKTESRLSGRLSDVAGKVDKLDDKVDGLAGKVNHIYGAAAALGALTGAVATVAAILLKLWLGE